MNPLLAFELLFFAVFGQTSYEDLLMRKGARPPWIESLFKIAFGVYMLVSVVVLINLLIAMMSDTYQRIQVFELLFFAVFGQTTTDHLKTDGWTHNHNNQPTWTEVLFKIVFGVYMLVSVVVLINLLIAMMTDTYQSIQAQSDIEWKFGLSKLIRSMHRTSTAPSPINLITTWLFYLVKICKVRMKKRKQRPSSLIQLMNSFQAGQQMSPRSKAGAKWLSKVKKGSQVAPKESLTVSTAHFSPLGSQMSFNMQTTRIEHVADWESIAKKYRALTGSTDNVKTESKNDEEDEDEEDNENNHTQNNSNPSTASN